MTQLENEMLNELGAAQGFTNDLAENLITQGVSASYSEGLDTLVPKVLGIDSGGVSMIPITWSALRTLRDAETLVPGQSYRIIDYTTTTVQADTTSASNDFDIVVTALSTNELSEIASCVRKSDDTYFENAKLEAWEIKYCIDNDTSRFAWADTVSGRGVIYYMKDEWENECPYDFKHIKFKKSDVWLYTFGGATDDSLTGNSAGNTIKESILSNKLSLNFNTFGANCNFNILGFNNNNNTFNYDCLSNKFGDNCSYNTFNYDCISNKFSDRCSGNKFGYGCRYNKFGGNCNSNTFGNSNYHNTFGINCQYNNFYHGTSGRTPKDYIRFIVLEEGCTYNNFYLPTTTSSLSWLQRIRIKGLEHTEATSTIITLPTSTKYEWVICYASDDALKQYCPDD